MLGVAIAVACGTPGQQPKEAPLTPQAQLFRKECAVCHGRDGNLTIDGAKDLTQSDLGKEEIAVVIKNGKGAMPSFGHILSDEEVQGLVAHVYGLRNAE